MPEPTPIEFNDHEKLLLNAYRPAVQSTRTGFSVFDVMTGLISLLAMGKMFMSGDIAFGFIAYALVLGRLCYQVIEGNRWHPHFCSIFAKYDAKIKALEAALADKQGNKGA